MSFYISKMVLRVEIPELKGKNYAETLDYFKSKLGEPKEIEKYNGELEWFSYEEKIGAFKEAFEMSYKSSQSENDKVGVEYVLGYEHDSEDFEQSISLSTIHEITQRMVELFEVDPATIGLFAYSWYNASDEPVEFN